VTATFSGRVVWCPDAGWIDEQDHHCNKEPAMSAPPAPEYPFIITLALPGCLPEGDLVEPFTATLDDAVTALLDEADQVLDRDDCDGGEAWSGDLALVESYRGAEGRGDLIWVLAEHGEVSIPLESYANDFGAHLTLTRVGEAS